MSSKKKVTTDSTRLKIVIVTSGLSSIVRPLLASRHSVVGIVDCTAGNGASAPESTLPRLMRRVYHMLKKPAPTLKSVARKHRVPYYHAHSVRAPQLEHRIRRWRPDLMVVYYAPLLRKNIFSLPLRGAINLHPSTLPKYRGGHPLFWTAYHLETHAGVTVHYIDAGMDTGDILYQKTVPIRPGLREADLEELMIRRHGVDLTLKAVDAVATGRPPRTPQPGTCPTSHAPRVTAAKLATLIDWKNWPITRLWSVLRFAEAWQQVTPPPPLGWQGGFRWTIGPYTREPVRGEPGSLARDEKGYYLVHPEGKIRLVVRYEMKRALKRLLSRLNSVSTTGTIVLAQSLAVLAALAEE
jgi:folate-dependent phosphoribosylglycinamide formyltransferase PurN